VDVMGRRFPIGFRAKGRKKELLDETMNTTEPSAAVESHSTFKQSTNPRAGSTTKSLKSVEQWQARIY
jgi:hypothetical protein